MAPAPVIFTAAGGDSVLAGEQPVEQVARQAKNTNVGLSHLGLSFANRHRSSQEFRLRSAAQCDSAFDFLQSIADTVYRFDQVCTLVQFAANGLDVSVDCAVLRGVFGTFAEPPQFRARVHVAGMLGELPQQTELGRCQMHWLAVNPSAVSTPIESQSSKDHAFRVAGLLRRYAEKVVKLRHDLSETGVIGRNGR